MSARETEPTSTSALRPVGPGSATWRWGVDWRAVLASRAVLLLEVAHPVVGAGVMDHSEFLSDRWDRITRTLASVRRVNGFHGSGAAVAEGLRQVHRDISGTDAQGRRYHALNSDAYLWVHATGYAGPADVRRIFDGGVDAEREDALFREWQDMAAVLRIPERVVPATRARFWDYYRNTVDDVLERNAATDLLIDLDRKPMPVPPKIAVPQPVWNGFAIPLAALLRLTTVGVLPSRFRERIGLEWNSARERNFDRAVATVRALDRVLPDRVRHPFAHRTDLLPDDRTISGTH
ncbi:oxygenase MpaB family protein [Nocardia vaccinii]|uniref:oxygenase MpaB family protein n=1 Tax=Nocardia vaccinii TaxID=1822 RepID=UPI000AABFB14|nr:oxygenase MpaB family protein [Nocardia vaccinii]